MLFRRLRQRGYHSMQLALVIGLFACGGLVCSMLLVDENDAFLGPRYWPRKSYGSPALATPRKPVTVPTVPQSGKFKSNDDEKNAVLQEHRVGDRKPSTSPLSLASRSSKFRGALLNRLRTKRANLARHFCHHPRTFDFALQLMLGFRRDSRQHHSEAGCFAIRQNTDVNAYDSRQVEQLPIVCSQHSVDITPRPRGFRR